MRRKKESEKTSSVKSGRWFIKITSLILSVLVVFFMIPVVSYAEMIETAEELLSAKPEKAEEKISLSYTSEDPAYELVEMREERAKYFRMEDGTYVVASYEYPVHTMQDGEWVDVDNSLTDNGNEIFTSNERIKFAKKITGNGSLFTLHESNHKLTLSLIGAVKKTEGKIIASESEGEKEEKKTLGKLINLENITSRVIYEDILEGVDIEYVLESTNLKENIIVKEKSEDGYSYSFELSLNNLTARMTPEGDVQIVNERGGVVYTIPAPVVYDSNGEYADPSSAQQSLEYMGNGKCRLTVSVSEDWMNAEERVYPVTVDPTLSVAESSVIDLYVDSANRTGYYHNATYLKVNNTSNAYWKIRDNYLPSLTSSAHITDAVIGFSAYGAADVGAYEISTNWSNYLCYEDTLDVIGDCEYYYGKGKISGNVVDYATVFMPAIYDKTERIEWNITEIAKLWFSGYNYGVGFKLMPDNVGNVAYLKSTEYNATPKTDEYKPTFILRYVDTKGIEDYYSYSSQSAGLAGSSSINLATGNLTFAISTLTSSDHLMPVSPTLVYEGSVAGSSYVYGGKSKIAFSSQSGMAYGFKLNLSETVVKEHFLNSKKETEDVYIYSDGDGTEHYFYHALDENGAPIANTYHDDSGLRLTLVVSSDGFTITSLDGTVKSFTKGATCPNETAGAWYLSRITDKVGNAVEITLNSNYLPTSTKVIPNGSTAIETLRFIYNSSGKLAVIRNVASRDAVVLKNSDSYSSSTYTSGTKYLRKIIYARGSYSTTDEQWLTYANGSSVSGITSTASASYEYSSNYNTVRLTKAKDDLSGRYLKYNYSGDKISSVTEYGSYGGEGQSIKIIYRNGYTEVTTSGTDDKISTTADNIITRYTFDKSARVISSYSTSYDRSEIYGAVSGTYEDQDNIKNNIKESVAIGGNPVSYLLNGSFEEENLVYWTHSGNVTVNESSEDATGIHEAVMSLGLTDSVNLKQGVSLSAGSYTLSMSYKTHSCTNDTNAIISVIRRSDQAIIAQKNLLLDSLNVSSELSVGLEFEINGSGRAIYDVSITLSGNAEDYSRLFVNDVVLVSGIGIGSYNHVKYGSFENSFVDSAGNTQDYSEFWDGASGIYTVEDMNNCAGVISSGVDSTQRLIQTVYTAPTSLLYSYDHESSDITFHTNSYRSFTVSGFGYADSILNNERARFCLGVIVYYYQGEGQSEIKQEYYFDFTGAEKQWQYVVGTFSLQLSSPLAEDWDKYKCVSRIDLICNYTGQVKNAAAYFDNIALIDSEHTSYSKYVYDEKGNLKTEKSGNDIIYYEYDESNNVVLVADDTGNIVVNDYDEDGKMLLSTSTYSYTLLSSIQYWRRYYSWTEYRQHINEYIAKTYTTYSYNTLGQCIKTITAEAEIVNTSNQDIPPKVQFVAGAKQLESESLYYTDTFIVGALKDETDTNGITTRYYYDNNGSLNAVINLATERGMSYTYDSLGRMIAATPVRCLGDPSGYIECEDTDPVNYTYGSNGNLSEINTPSTQYNFGYDQFGNNTYIDVGFENNVIEYEYNSNNGKLSKITYGNGCTEDCGDRFCEHRYTERYVYDHLDNISEIWYTVGGVETKAYEYNYTKDGLPYSVKDFSTGKTTVYRYDEKGRLVGYGEDIDGDFLGEYSSDISYDDHSRVTWHALMLTHNQNGTDIESNLFKRYTYSNDGKISEYCVSGLEQHIYYDEFDRLSGINSSGGLYSGYENNVTLTYEEDATNLSMDRVATYTSWIGTGTNATSTTYSYEYDANGSIISITYSDGKKITYEYDDINQLIRENNQLLNATYVYAYDTAGNILHKKTYNYTTVATSQLGSPTGLINYTCGSSDWGDQLTRYDGQLITYDRVGNPLSYYNGTAYTFTWQGRRLKTAVKGTQSFTFSYNNEGIRTSKTVNGVEHIYLVDGSTILSEQWGEHLVVYVYDVNGAPIGMNYRNSSYAANTWDVYWFEKNLQGDVVAVYDDDGTKLVSYKYDAWGNFTTQYHNNGLTSTARYNPFTYRGYYYDTDLGLYYLNSRYYDSVVGRFINADGAISDVGGDIRGYNMYSYCFNNPVNMTDPDGNWPQWAKDAVKWVAGNIVKPIVKTVESALSYVDATYSTGLAVSISGPGGVVDFQAGVSMDTDGNIALQLSLGGGLCATPSHGFSVTKYESVSNAPSVDNLTGPGYQIGASGGAVLDFVPIAAGGDFNIIPDAKTGEVYFGVTTNRGFGTPGFEAHAGVNQTVTIPGTEFNIFDLARKIYDKIMEW